MLVSSCTFHSFPFQVTYKILLAFGTKIVTILILEYIKNLMNDVMNTFCGHGQENEAFLNFFDYFACKCNVVLKGGLAATASVS